VRTIRRGTAPFELTGSGPMSLEVRGIDHQPFWFTALSRQFGKYPVELPQAVPPDKAIVDSLVRAAVLGRVTLALPIAVHEDNP
jgi:hypothetical protein